MPVLWRAKKPEKPPEVKPIDTPKLNRAQRECVDTVSSSNCQKYPAQNEQPLWRHTGSAEQNVRLSW